MRPAKGKITVKYNGIHVRRSVSGNGSEMEGWVIISPLVQFLERDGVFATPDQRSISSPARRNGRPGGDKGGWVVVPHRWTRNG